MNSNLPGKNGNNQEISADLIPRRTFLDIVFSGSLILTIAALIGVAAKFLWPSHSSHFKGKSILVGDLESFEVGTAVRRVAGSRGVLIIRTKTGFSGLSLACTHKGCNVDWDENKKVVVCPCHNGFFDLDGNVLGGPPPRPLTRYTVKVLGDKVYLEG